MKVMLLGRLAEIAGWRERDIDAASLDALRAALAEPGVRVVVDRALTPNPDLGGAEEVAFLPIVSGG
jgi:molybdopterin synthase sulfur carrier subunit